MPPESWSSIGIRLNGIFFFWLACQFDSWTLSVFLPRTLLCPQERYFESWLKKYILAWLGNRYRRRDLHQTRVRYFFFHTHTYTHSFSLDLAHLRFIRRDKVYIAPSGVQKERIEPEHIFVLPYPQPTTSPHADRVFLRRPQLNLNESACTPLFWNSFELRDAGSCIHTHSQHAVMATLLWKGTVFTISHQVSSPWRNLLFTHEQGE